MRGLFFTGHDHACASRIRKFFGELAGRVGSGHEVFEVSRAGSDRVRKYSESHGSGGVGSGHPDPDPTRENRSGP